MPSVAQLVYEKPQTYQHEFDASRHDGVDGELETKSTFLGPCGARYSISLDKRPWFLILHHSEKSDEETGVSFPNKNDVIEGKY